MYQRTLLVGKLVKPWFSTGGWGRCPRLISSPGATSYYLGSLLSFIACLSTLIRSTFDYEMHRFSPHIVNVVV